MCSKAQSHLLADDHLNQGKYGTQSIVAVAKVKPRHSKGQFVNHVRSLYEQFQKGMVGFRHAHTIQDIDDAVYLGLLILQARHDLVPNVANLGRMEVYKQRS
jgi:hypothetical protein